MNDKDAVYSYREIGTSFCQQNVMLSKAEMRQVDPILPKIRTKTKSRISCISLKKTSKVKIVGHQMDVEEACRLITVAFQKSPEDEYADLIGRKPVKKKVIDDAPKSVDLEIKKPTEMEEKKTIDEQLKVLFAREKMLKQKLKNRLVKPQEHTPKSLSKSKPSLKTLCASGPLKSHFWAYSCIPFPVPLPKNRVKAIKSISTVTLIEPSMNKVTRKLLIFKKILEFFEAKNVDVAQKSPQKHFRNYFQLLSKLVFKRLSKESRNVVEELRNSLQDLKKSEKSMLSPKLYSHLNNLYCQIANPPPEDLGRMLDVARTLSTHLEKKSGKQLSIVKNSKKLKKFILERRE